MTKCLKMASFTIGPTKNNSFPMNLEAFVAQEITGNIPTQSLDKTCVNNLPDLKLADHTFFKNSPIDMLHGANVYPIVLIEVVRKTILGSLLPKRPFLGGY